MTPPTKKKRVDVPEPRAMRAAATAILAAHGLHSLVGVVFPKVAPGAVQSDAERVALWLLQEAEDHEIAAERIAEKDALPKVIVSRPGER